MTRTTQDETVLRLLREAGARGVSAHDLVYRHGITRGAAVVHRLREAGHVIRTVHEGKTPDGRRKLSRYVLYRSGRMVVDEQSRVARFVPSEQG